ncbi:hypothetical protein NPX13_g9574 [Xylaria arbuscula]|uniref:Erythromycin esterase n=1 Tax=Xylaria arbuscula TaxID=114810 RepID=A0A9W8TIB0_9PEZI|nr:hypothetical protein NPX13_g9574 [Xylaria arbuscula]
MSPRCRRSARIASASKRSTESPAPQQLAPVAEANDAVELGIETPSRNGNGSSKRRKFKRTTMSSPMPNPATPSTSAPLKLAMSEMHPSKVHPTMAAPSSGLRNGFIDIDYSTTPMQTMIQNTPSKTPAPSSEFTFRYAPPGADRELGPAARAMMDSVREQAAAIKAQLMEERDRERAEQHEANSRKIAQARGRSGRFSAVHMAEFKKMDSIEGHASSFRAAPGRFTPVKAGTSNNKPITPLKAGVKRSQSKANLDEPSSARPKTIPRPSNKTLENSLENPSAPRFVDMGNPGPEYASKRIRKRIEDDTSAMRPVSRDGSSIPRPKSSGNDSVRSGIPRSQTLGSLMTPTKSSLARINSIKTPTVSLVRSPSQPDLEKVNSFSAKVGSSLLKSPGKIDLAALARSPSKKGFGGLKMFGAGNETASASTSSTSSAQVETPGRFSRLRSILKRQPSGSKTKSAIPAPATAIKTPTRHNLVDTMFPAVPLTTPGRKHGRHVDFTPDTKQAALAQESPSPIKPSVPRSTALSKIAPPKFVAGGKGVVNKPAATGEITYPDLSAYQGEEDVPQPPHESVPGTFTFRSDHTICFDNSPSNKGFGSAAGQASLRQVRESTAPASSSTRMPGSFPSTATASPNKENADPLLMLRRKSIPHGMTNKKRHRASSDEEEEEDEGARRGRKKLRKTPVAEGHALVAPKLAAPSPAPASPLKKGKAAASIRGSTPLTPSPQKKKTMKTGGLSLSRLNLLAQPKIRK